MKNLKQISKFLCMLSLGYAPLFGGGAPVQKIGLNVTTTIQDYIDYHSTPPDTRGSVGPEQIIIVVNQGLRSINKKTGKPDNVLKQSLSGLFRNTTLTDPRVEYDRFSKRWFITCLDFGDVNEQNNGLHIAMSNGPVITDCTRWKLFVLPGSVISPSSPNTFFDYDMLGIDQNALYIGGNIFANGINGAFLDTSVVVIPKQTILKGNPEVTVFENVFKKFGIAAALPADNLDPDPKFGYVMGVTNFVSPGQTSNKLFFFRIKDPGGQPKMGPVIKLDVPTYMSPNNAPSKGNLLLAAPNGNLIETLDGRLITSHVRNGHFFTTHCIGVDQKGVSTGTPDRSGNRWYEFNLAPDGGKEQADTVPKLHQFGTLFDSTVTATPLWYYFPAIMTNKNLDLTLCSSVSGQNAFINGVCAGRKKSDPKGKLRNPFLLTKSTFPFNFGIQTDPAGQRWGDFSYTCTDPDDDITMWTFQEWAAVQNAWGVQATQLLPKK